MPARTATMRIVTTKAATSLRSKIAARSVTSGMLAPAPPMIRAITAPMPIPFSRRTALMGMIVSARIYIGTPITAATGMASGLSGPARETIRSPGMNP